MGIIISVLDLVVRVIGVAIDIVVYSVISALLVTAIAGILGYIIFWVIPKLVATWLEESDFTWVKKREREEGPESDVKATADDADNGYASKEKCAVSKLESESSATLVSLAA